jgi:hypothetical protein
MFRASAPRAARVDSDDLAGCIGASISTAGMSAHHPRQERLLAQGMVARAEGAAPISVACLCAKIVGQVVPEA